MPTETDKPNTTPPAAVADPRDAEIAGLRQELSNLSKENAALAQDLEDARKKLKQRNTVPAAPSGDYCVLNGKTYQVLGTVTTRFASDHGRKNNSEDEELVIIKH